jgi:hypothetical protein
MGMCPGRAYFTGDEWVPCRTAVSLRHPSDRVLASYLACQADPAADHCAGEYLDASVVGFKRWAEHQKNFVLLRLAQVCNRERVQAGELWNCSRKGHNLPSEVGPI